MLTVEYAGLANSSALWYCPDCGTPHHSDIVYVAPDCSRFGNNNIGSDYSNISESDPSTTVMTSPFNITGRFTDSSIHSLSNPEAASSPKPSSAKGNTPKKHLHELNISLSEIRI